MVDKNRFEANKQKGLAILKNYTTMEDTYYMGFATVVHATGFMSSQDHDELMMLGWHLELGKAYNTWWYYERDDESPFELDKT